jgi:hypothetical protein
MLDGNDVEKLSAECEYTLALRVSQETLDFKAIEAALGVSGAHSRIDRSARRFRPAPAFDQWEQQAEAGDSYIFTSLVAAFDAISFRPVNGRAHAHVKAHWWCGCFHVTSPSTTVFPRALLALLGASGYPLHLDNYRSSDDAETVSTEDEGDEMPAEDEFLGLQCGFTGDFCSGGVLEAFRADEPEYDRRVICEHSQYAFDGGPTVLGDAAASLASMGYDLHIEWMQR